MEKKTILILANSSGGLVDFRNELIQELLKEYRVAASLPDEVKTAELSAEGVEVIHTPINRRGVNPVQDLQLLLTYRKLLRRIRPDLVLTYTIKPNCYGGLACAEAGVPYISTITGLGSTFQKTGPLLSVVETLYRGGLKKAACVFFQNEENQEIFRSEGLLSGPARLVSGSGVNVDYWKALPYPESEDITNFLFVGRVMREKGIDEFLEAARELHGTNVVFSICGYCDEDYQQILEERAEAGEVVLLGFHPDMHEIYAAASAIVMPTYHEGMSNVLMEASACARPVIASNISGCREIIDSGITGYTFTPHSSKELVHALRKFLVLPRTQRALMGESARAKMIRQFDRRQVAAAYLEEIHRALGEE